MDKTQKGYSLLIFLISPFLGLMTLFKNKDEKFLIFFGTLFFGLAGSVFVYAEGTDGASHLLSAKEFYMDMTLGEYFTKAFQVLTFETTDGATDIYMHTIKYLSASVLQSPALIHVFAGLVLGYFFTKSALLVLKNELHVRKGYILLGFMVLFLLIRSLGALNSIRMWTGMWVLFYGCYSYALKKDKKYFIIIIFSVFVHFSYAVILLPVATSYFARNWKRTIIILYAVSFFTSLGFSFIEAYIPKSTLIESKQNIYAIDSDEDRARFEDRYASTKSQNTNFYKAFGEISYLNYSILGLSLILIFFYLKKDNTDSFNALIAIGVGLYTFSNLMSFIPSLQGRTKTIAATFILASAIYLQLHLKKFQLTKITLDRIQRFLVLFLISSTPMVIYQISYIFQNFSFFLLMFPQVSWILGDQDASIRAVIGLLID